LNSAGCPRLVRPSASIAALVATMRSIVCSLDIDDKLT
jgi:hypothetical protein